MRKYFGTDGVRGIANSELDSNLAFNLGRAGGYVLGKENKGNKVKVVVGRDTRISGDMLESALVSGLMSVGCDVITIGIAPTPAVSFLVKKLNADCGVVISASHNPMEFNGIKFFNKKGFKLDDKIELEIEEYIDAPERIDYYPTGNLIGTKIDMKEALNLYVEYLSTIANVDFKDLKVVLDCANGASFEVAPNVFNKLGATVITINNSPDGININDNCGSTHIELLQSKVVEVNADLGLAYDGDADRLIAVDEKGCVLDGDIILCICSMYLKKIGKLSKDTLVATVMSNLGLSIFAKENNINIAKTSVGDRYVLEEMLKHGYNLGGEQSGHIIFLDYNTTGDGVLSSLILSKILVESNKKISELSSLMTQYPQVLINAKIKNSNKSRYMDVPEIKSKIEDIESILDGEGRVLIRPSGTEPLVRVMLEGKDKEQLLLLAQELANLIEERLS